MIGVRKLDATFDRPKDFDLEKTWARLLDDFGRGRRLVRIRIDAPATNDFESFAWKDDQVITKYADHWIVELRLDDDEWLVPLVLSYGGLVQVLEPASLRERVVVALESALRLHRVGDEQS
jgi:predicted DNA-binding transcriptional regulator YafY